MYIIVCISLYAFSDWTLKNIITFKYSIVDNKK